MSEWFRQQDPFGELTLCQLEEAIGKLRSLRKKLECSSRPWKATSSIPLEVSEMCR
jgi:hypothetical protein